jgi:hypothetical protein
MIGVRDESDLLIIDGPIDDDRYDGELGGRDEPKRWIE